MREIVQPPASRLPSAGRASLMVTAVAVALTLAMAAPVVVAPGERVFGSEIVGRHHDAYTMMGLFGEGRLSLGAFTQPATDWPGALLGRLVGGVAAYNLLVLATFPLAALFTWLLARRLGLGAGGAALAAFAFAFSPFHLAHAAYHPHIVQTQWIPLYFLALWSCLLGWSPWRGLLLAASVGLLALSNFYFGYFAAVLTPVAILGWWLARPGGGERSPRALLGTCAVLAAIAASGILYALTIGARVLERLDEHAFAADELHRYGARWWSYPVPPVENLLLGGLARRLWEGRAIADGLIEQQVGLGVGLGLLALVAVVAWGIRARGARKARGGGGALSAHGASGGLPLGTVPVLAAVATAAFVASLAPAPGGDLQLTRPATYLHAALPVFRAYARFGVFVDLMVALLAGIGLSWLLSRDRGAAREPGGSDSGERWALPAGSGWGRLAATAALLLAAIEIAPFPPWRWHHVLPTSGHRWIADRPGASQSRPALRLLECVRGPKAVERSVQRFLGHELSWLRGPVPDCGEPRLAGKLAALRFTHVLVRPESIAGRRLADHGPPPGLELRYEADDAAVLAVTAPPAPVYVLQLLGFSWREYRGAASYRWMGDSGTLLVTSRGDASGSREGGERLVTLELELSAFPDERGLTVRLDGEEAARLRVPTEPRAFEIGPLALAPATHRLTLEPDEPAVAPRQVTGSDDRRPLSIAVWGWRFREETAASP